MLQPPDLRGAATTPVDDDSWARLRPPRPGADDAYPSIALPHSEHAVSAVVAVNGAPITVVEYVAVCQSSGARRYLRDLRRELEACGGVDNQGARWTIMANRVAGPDSLLLRLRESFEQTTTKDTYVAVARVGRVLIVVAAGHRDLVEELITPAVRRASILL